MTIQLDHIRSDNQPRRESMASGDVAALRRAGVEIHAPGDPGYNLARQPWNIAVDQRPAAVARPVDAAQVTAVVRAAAELGWRVAPRATE